MHVEFLGIPRERAGVAELELEAGTLGEALEALVTRFPQLQELISEGRPHASVAISLNADLFISNPSTRLERDDRLLILSADAGG